MILRSNTVVELLPGTRINPAGTVAPLVLSGRVLGKLLHDEPYSASAGLPGGLLNGAYMELLGDVGATADDGSVVDLGRGAWIFVEPGSDVAVVSKADDGKAAGGSASFGLGFALGVGLFAGLLGVAIGSGGR